MKRAVVLKHIAASKGSSSARASSACSFAARSVAQDVDTFVREDLAFAERANGAGAAPRIREETREHIASCKIVGERLLGNIIDTMSADNFVGPTRGA